MIDPKDFKEFLRGPKYQMALFFFEKKFSPRVSDVVVCWPSFICHRYWLNIKIFNIKDRFIPIEKLKPMKLLNY